MERQYLGGTMIDTKTDRGKGALGRTLETISNDVLQTLRLTDEQYLAIASAMAKKRRDTQEAITRDGAKRIFEAFKGDSSELGTGMWSVLTQIRREGSVSVDCPFKIPGLVVLQHAKLVKAEERTPSIIPEEGTGKEETSRYVLTRLGKAVAELFDPDAKGIARKEGDGKAGDGGR